MSSDANPWVPPQATPEEGESSAPPPAPVIPPWQRPRLDPESGGVPQPTRRLAWWKCPGRLAINTAWWAIGVHGGAGATRLVTALNIGGRDVPQHWPVAPEAAGPRPVLLVARTDLHGLEAAQDAIREWWWKLTPPGLELAGLVLMADAPGRLPTPLRNHARALAGTVPEVWHVPWVPEWRTGEMPQRFPKELTEVRDHVQSLGHSNPPEPPATEARARAPKNAAVPVPHWTAGRSSA